MTRIAFASFHRPALHFKSELKGVPVPPSPAAKDPDLARLEVGLAERIGAPVTIRYGAGGRGQLVVEFDGLEILEGVLERLGYRP